MPLRQLFDERVLGAVGRFCASLELLRAPHQSISEKRKVKR